MKPDNRAFLDQCALRLPFHVNGTLEAPAQDAMRQALQQSDSLRHSAAWLSALRTELRELAVHNPDQAGWERIARSISAEAFPPEDSSAPSALDVLKRLLRGS